MAMGAKLRVLRLRLGLAALLIGCTAAAQTGTANGEAGDASVEFDIPAQPVPAALSEFARQTGLEFLFVTQGFEDVPANAVVGTYPIQEALDQLLAGTGLVGSYTPGSSIAVSPLPETASPAAPEPDETDAPAVAVSGPVVEEVVVTGSRIPGAESASPLIAVSRAELDQAGFATVEQFFERLPQTFGGGASLDTLTDTGNDTNVVGGNVGNEAGGTSVNLRGLGASSTLILVDGRRLSPSGFGSAFTNISSIPVTAIERVEVLTDGASAIYGSDAIGGVVNFVLRDDYEGAETRLRYGSDWRGDTSDVLLGQTFAVSWDDGGALFVYEYYDAGNLANRDRDFTATSDLTRFGGTDRRQAGGSPANIQAGGRLWAIPSGQDGTSLSAADFPADANGDPERPPNRFNDRSLGDVLPALRRNSAILRLRQATDAAEYFADIRYSTQTTTWRRNFSPIDIAVTDANPFFVDPTGTGLTTVTVSGYALDNELGPQINTGDIESLGASVGIRFDLGERWQADLIGHWAKEDQERGTNLSLDIAALEAAANPSTPNPDPATVFNPFGDDPNANAAVIDTLVDREPGPQSATDNALRSLSLDLDGSVFELPGGPVQLVAGAEYRRESLTTARDFENQGDVVSDLRRDVTSLYTELYLPLTSPSNRRPGIERLDLSLAARYEYYSDVGNSINPKFGLVWSPTASLTFRGTYGTSFKAPALLDLDVNRRSANFAVYFSQPFVEDGSVPFAMIARSGGNADLEPEQATTLTAGIQWQPSGAEGLSLDLTYFEVNFEDRIDQALTDFANADDPRFASLVNMSPTQAQIAALINDPGWLNPANASEDDLLSGAVDVAIVDGRLNNLARSLVSGVELKLLYQFETAVGLIDLNVNGSYMFDFQRALLDGDPLVEEVDTYGRPVEFRARVGLTWSRGAWSVSGFVDHTDGYTDSLSDPSRSIDSWTTVDVNLGYDTGNRRGLLGNTRIALTIQNVFDTDPPFVNTPAGLAYDSYNADPEGRMLALQIVRQW